MITKNKPQIRQVKVTREKLQEVINRAAENEKDWVVWDSKKHLQGRLSK